MTEMFLQKLFVFVSLVSILSSAAADFCFDGTNHSDASLTGKLNVFGELPDRGDLKEILREHDSDAGLYVIGFQANSSSPLSLLCVLDIYSRKKHQRGLLGRVSQLFLSGDVADVYPVDTFSKKKEDKKKKKKKSKKKRKKKKKKEVDPEEDDNNFLVRPSPLFDEGTFEVFTQNGRRRPQAFVVELGASSPHPGAVVQMAVNHLPDGLNINIYNDALTFDELAPEFASFYNCTNYATNATTSAPPGSSAAPTTTAPPGSSAAP